jgi:hypothetical protein
MAKFQVTVFYPAGEVKFFTNQAPYADSSGLLHVTDENGEVTAFYQLPVSFREVTDCVEPSDGEKTFAQETEKVVSPNPAKSDRLQPKSELSIAPSSPAKVDKKLVSKAMRVIDLHMGRSYKGYWRSGQQVSTGDGLANAVMRFSHFALSGDSPYSLSSLNRQKRKSRQMSEYLASSEKLLSNPYVINEEKLSQHRSVWGRRLWDGSTSRLQEPAEQSMSLVVDSALSACCTALELNKVCFEFDPEYLRMQIENGKARGEAIKQGLKAVSEKSFNLAMYLNQLVSSWTKCVSICNSASLEAYDHKAKALQELQRLFAENS